MSQVMLSNPAVSAVLRAKYTAQRAPVRDVEIKPIFNAVGKRVSTKLHLHINLLIHS